MKIQAVNRRYAKIVGKEMASKKLFLAIHLAILTKKSTFLEGVASAVLSLSGIVLIARTNGKQLATSLAWKPIS